MGPFTITKCLGKGLYSLQSIENPDVVIKSVTGVHIKPYLTPHNTFSTHSSSNSSSYTPPVDKSVLHKTEVVLSSGDSFHKRGDSSASSSTSKSQHSKEKEATLQHLSASKQHMEEHYYADNHLSNVQDDGNPLYAWKCVTYTLEGCKSESLNVYDHESTQMGDLAFVLESSKHITVPELPNPHSEMVTRTPTLSGGFLHQWKMETYLQYQFVVLSHYKESCIQPALSTTASIPNPTSSPACPSQVPQSSSCPQRDFPKSPNSQMQLKIAITKDKCQIL